MLPCAPDRTDQLDELLAMNRVMNQATNKDCPGSCADLITAKSCSECGSSQSTEPGRGHREHREHRAGKGAQTELGRQLSPSWLPARAAQANRALARALTWIKSDLFPAVAGTTRSFQAANKGKQKQRLLE